MTPFFAVLTTLMFFDLTGVASMAVLPDWVEQILPVMCVAQLIALAALIVFAVREAAARAQAKVARSSVEVSKVGH